MYLIKHAIDRSFTFLFRGPPVRLPPPVQPEHRWGLQPNLWERDCGQVDFDFSPAAAFSSFTTTFFSATNTTSVTCGLAAVCFLTAAFASLASATVHQDSFQMDAVL